MPLESSLVGTRVGPATTEVDARWTMAYAAALEDYLPCYLDTRHADGIVTHPVFPVCIEWPAAIALHDKMRSSKLAHSEAARGVHATYDVTLHRAIRPPERLTTTLTLAAVQRLKPGAYELMRFETVDTQGRPVCTTWYGTIYRGVEVDGPDRPAADAPAPLKAPGAGDTARAEIPLAISPGAAHVYTECARIWNPVHTDSSVAAAAGLPAIILHGTATMAMAVSKIVAAEAGYNPERVRRIHGRFAAMVLMPSMATVRINSRTPASGGEAVSFDVLNADGSRAIRDGMVLLGE
ncbi:MAG TPA: MaoC family dehydratase N-terminal domain-containing protein [Candidatus Binataceae bacterium]|nr:MaoC family dehydratase N-terminal domain-containing protein [Candidatus Binataceae bacterium]